MFVRKTPTAGDVGCLALGWSMVHIILRFTVHAPIIVFIAMCGGLRSSLTAFLKGDTIL